MSDINPDYLAGLAQLETRGGAASIKGPAGEDSNNLFNIKDFTGKGYRAKDTAEGSNDAYRVYASREESIADVKGLLARKYPKALTATSPQEFAQALKDGGYATDPNYVQKLTNVIVGGKFDPAAMKAAVSSDALRSVAPGRALTTDEAWTDQTLAGKSKFVPRDEDGNVIDTPLEKQGRLNEALGLSNTGNASRDGIATREAIGPGPDLFGMTVRQEDHEVKAQQAKDAVTWDQRFGAASLNDGFIRGLVRFVAGTGDYGPPEAGFKTPDEALAGKNSEQMDELQAAQNPRHLAAIQFEQREAEERMVTLASTGAWGQFGYGALATLQNPLSYVGPYAVARVGKLAGIGSAAFAAEGRTAAAVATAFGENAIANVAQDQIGASMVGEHRTPGDVFSAMAMAMIPGVLHGVSAHSAAVRHADAASFQKMTDAAVVKEAQTIAKARENLGPEATQADLLREVDRINTAQVRDVVQAGVSKTSADARIMPHPDDIKAELEAEAKATLDAEKPAPEGGAKTVTEEETAPTTTEATAGEPAPLVNKEGSAPATKPEISQKEFDSESPTFFNDSGSAEVRIKLAHTNKDWQNGLRSVSEGLSLADADKLPNGIHIRDGIASIPQAAPALRAAQTLHRLFLGSKSKLIIGLLDPDHVAYKAQRDAAAAEGKTWTPPQASVASMGKTHFIGLLPQSSGGEMIKAVVHEIGHAIFHENLSGISPKLLDYMGRVHQDFLTGLRAGDRNVRFKRYAEGSGEIIHNINDAELTPQTTKVRSPLAANAYNNSFDEYTAEAFTRYFQRRAREDGNPLMLDKGVIAHIKAAWERIKSLYAYAKGAKLLADDTPFDKFFDDVMHNTVGRPAEVRAPVTAPEHFDSGIRLPELSNNLDAVKPSGALDSTVDTQARHGLDILPEGTAAEAGEKRMLTHAYQRADAWAKANPMDEAWIKRADALTDNGVFNVASTGLLMLKSKNPLVRMTASQLLEDAAGVSGFRGRTAAISKYTHERLFLGNSVNDLQDNFAQWKKSNGGSFVDDLTSGQGWDRYNRLIAEEIEGRRQNGGRTTGSGDANVRLAADSMEKAYERMRLAQVSNETLGWAGLPETSAGYMPHKMSSNRVRNLTTSERGVLTQTLTDQFITIEGFDMSFAQNLAGRYIDRVRQKALGGYDAPVALHQAGAADVVEDAMRAMGLSRQEIRANMARYYNAGPGHTKSRLDLDLLAQHTVTNADGTSSQIRLLDLFETNQLQLLRGQAGRVSGEVALARNGIYGKPGMDLLRRGMGLGGDGQHATPRELEAFDQVASEFFNEPFGTAEGKWMERARTLNSVARLGGVVFNQFAEFINGIAHVGVGRTMGAIGGIARLRGEIIALSKGEHVDNPLLGSIEHMNGAEFGTDAYKMAFPFDSPDAVYPTYGRDTVTMTDRLLRGSAHLQSKISFWRAIHSAQNRGFAEQIVQKAAQFIKSGADDAALNDMGIHASLRARLAADIDKIATFDGSGKLVSFDLMKATDTAAAEEFGQAVLRGTSQIIQSTFIGETGKWAHSGYLKMLTQFRTFSITSVEKQWARQRNNQGTAKALGILVGSMSIAVPVYMARTYASSIGRADQDAYLERELSPYKLTRATMNYVALSGLAGDFMDALTAVAPDAVQEKIGSATGGRTGTTTSAVGNLVAPAAGYVDDVWGALQNLDDPKKAAKILPFSRVPYLVPAINALTH